MGPDPLHTLGGGNNTIFNLVAKVEMQDVHAGVEGLVAVVQSGGNCEVSTDVSLLGTGVLDGDHLIHVVLGGGHTQRILLALSGADDGVQLLALGELLRAAVAVTFFFDQVDLHVTDGEGVGLIVRVGEVGQRGSHDGRCQQGNATGRLR